MAIIAVQTEKISEREAASRFEVARSTLQRRLSKVQVAQMGHLPVDEQPIFLGKDGKSYKPPASKEEIDSAIELKKEGLTIKEIARKLQRGERTIQSWLAKNKTQDAPQSSKNSQTLNDIVAKNQQPKAENLTNKTYPKLTQDIVKKETKISLKRSLQLQELKSLDEDLNCFWRYAQQRFDKDGRSVLRNHMGLADEAMGQLGLLKEYGNSLGLTNQPTYAEVLLEVDRIAKNISASARKAVYLLGYFDSIPD